MIVADMQVLAYRYAYKSQTLITPVGQQEQVVVLPYRENRCPRVVVPQYVRTDHTHRSHYSFSWFWGFNHPLWDLGYIHIGPSPKPIFQIDANEENRFRQRTCMHTCRYAEPDRGR